MKLLKERRIPLSLSFSSSSSSNNCNYYNYSRRNFTLKEVNKGISFLFTLF